jgi:hypothetical protein
MDRLPLLRVVPPDGRIWRNLYGIERALDLTQRAVGFCGFCAVLQSKGVVHGVRNDDGIFASAEAAELE